MIESVSIKFDQSGIDAALDKLTAKANNAVRPAAQAGAQLLYDEARARCPVSAEAHFFYGTSYKKSGTRYFFSPGSLRDSIYQVFSKDKSTEDKSTYHIAWNHQKVPYGFMVEFGTSRAAAHPFLRPAYEAVKYSAINLAKTVFAERMGAA